MVVKFDPESIEFNVVTVDLQGQIRDRCQAAAQSRRVVLDSDVGLELVSIPAGTFVMGAPQGEQGASLAQIPQHTVTVQSFFMSRFPITQAQWQMVATLPPAKQLLNPTPACFKGLDRPVEQISWHDATEFCHRLSQYLEQPCRLPSEAEWEYACRARTSTPFHFGPTCTTELANYSGVDWEYEGKICSRGAYGSGPLGEDRRETTPVGYFQVANAFGLSDLHGNVREWCADSWHENYQGAPTDGTAWLVNGDMSQRVLRGGSWNCGPSRCRSAFRSRLNAESRLYDVGFRVVCCCK